MLQSLKSRIPILLILGVAPIALIVVVAPFVLGLITGPKAFDPYEVDDVTTLKGKYVEADLDTLVDYYAETVESQEYHQDKTIARDYNADPAAFQRKVQTARRAEGETAVTTAE